MVSKSLALILLTLFFLTPQIHAQTPTSPPPAPTVSPANLTGILDKGGQYTTFIHLLFETQQINQIQIQINSNSSEGFTVFAPTDNAFQTLKSGTINNLTDQQKTQLILYHIASKFYTLTQLVTVSNPVRTREGNWGLNFTSQGKQVNVSTGVVVTPINNALWQEFPLAVYQVDKVLLPLELFGAKSPASAPSPKSSSNNKTSPSESPHSGGVGAPSRSGDGHGRNVGLGLVLGLGFFCIGALS